MDFCKAFEQRLYHANEDDLFEYAEARVAI